MKDLAYRNLPTVAALPVASAELAGVLVRLETDLHVYHCDGSSWADLSTDARLLVVRLAADVSNSSTTLANVSGLLLALDANSTYQIEGRVVFQSAATTTGIRLTQTVPAGAVVVAQWSTPTSLTAATLANQRAADAGAASTAIDTANANTLATVSMVVNTAANAGSLQIRFASEVATSAVVVKAMSHLVALKVS